MCFDRLITGFAHVGIRDPDRNVIEFNQSVPATA